MKWANWLTKSWSSKFNNFHSKTTVINSATWGTEESYMSIKVWFLILNWITEVFSISFSIGLLKVFSSKLLERVLEQNELVYTQSKVFNNREEVEHHVIHYIMVTCQAEQLTVSNYFHLKTWTNGKKKYRSFLNGSKTKHKPVCRLDTLNLD